MDAARRAALESRTRYDAADVEGRIFARWQDAGCFDADPSAPGEPYCIALPPPNVTGSLHMGHALNGAIQDLLIRLKRMQGRNVLWQPGTDHAGIATQSVVEKLLAQGNQTRHDLGREAFVEKVWAWRRETGSQIIEQYKRLGSSMDYRRERFTMDDAYADAVLRVFVALHERGLIYRAHRLVNWSVPLRTAISDLEVDHRDVEDVLYRVRYELDGGGEITVATVRPVTILADVAVAVNPDDPRHAGLVGRTAIVPLTGRRVPVIADRRVEIGFGTGALKITPGHDPTDFEIGEEHGLPVLSMLTEHGTLTDLRPDWEGIDASEGHDRAVAELRETGALVGEEPYLHAVGFCSRSGARIEPLVSLQWFCRMDELAAPAIAAVREGRIRFHPQRMERIYFDWMEAIRPWCISRQLWWGHRLPVWFRGDDESDYVVAIDRPDGDGWRRSDDVLDTWFSSALWPYATLGWPEATDSLARWYPGDVLVTGRDIINLWVARMIMTGLAFAGDIPFTDVVINSTIQAADGRRMSKSLGTGVDPLDLIDRYGADATRYGLLKMCSTQDVRFAEPAIDEGRALANKLWNAARLVLLQVDAEATPTATVSEPIDAWILTRLARAIRAVAEQYETYEFSAAVKDLYAFVFDDFCDWYLEALKLRLYGDDAVAKRRASETALYVLDRLLRLAHPVLPFVTEEIAAFTGADGLLMRASFPAADDVPVDLAADAQVAAVIELVTQLRSLRADASIGPRSPLVVTIEGGTAAAALTAQADLLAGLGHATIGPATADATPIVIGDATVLVSGDGLGAAVRQKLERRRATVEGELAKESQKLGNSGFVDRAPPDIVEQVRAHVRQLEREAAELRQRLAGG